MWEKPPNETEGCVKVGCTTVGCTRISRRSETSQFPCGPIANADKLKRDLWQMRPQCLVCALELIGARTFCLRSASTVTSVTSVWQGLTDDGIQFPQQNPLPPRVGSRTRHSGLRHSSARFPPKGRSLHRWRLRSRKYTSKIALPSGQLGYASSALLISNCGW